MKNIVQAADAAQAADWEFGGRAYPMYHEACRRFAEFYGVGFVPTVEAFVALSPNNSYHSNLRSLAAVLSSVAFGIPMDELTVSTYRACATRAHSYLSGETSFLDTVRGKKITAFRHNILYPVQSNRVTIDGHMISVWLGEELTMREAAARLRGQYEEIESDFRTLARRRGIAPCALQATLWSARKRRLGIVYSGQGELFSGLDRWSEIADPMNYPPFQIEAWREAMAEKGKRSV